jgi:hypothetical protein
MEINQPKSIKSKMRGCKLRTGVNWQGVLKQKGKKQGLVVHSNGSKLLCQCWSIFPGVIQGTYMDTLLHTNFEVYMWMLTLLLCNASTWLILKFVALLVLNSRQQNIWIWNLCALRQYS